MRHEIPQVKGWITVSVKSVCPLLLPAFLCIHIFGVGDLASCADEPLRAADSPSTKIDELRELRWELKGANAAGDFKRVIGIANQILQRTEGVDPSLSRDVFLANDRLLAFGELFRAHCRLGGEYLATDAQKSAVALARELYKDNKKALLRELDTLAWHYTCTFRPRLAVDVLDDAVKIARSYDRDEYVRILSSRICAEVASSRYRDAATDIALIEEIASQEQNVAGSRQFASTWRLYYFASAMYYAKTDIDHQRSIATFEQFLKRASGIADLQKSISNAYPHLIGYCAEDGQYDAAEEYLRKARSQLDRHPNRDAEHALLISHGRLLLRQERYDDAIRVLTEAVHFTWGERESLLNRAARCHARAVLAAALIEKGTLSRGKRASVRYPCLLQRKGTSSDRHTTCRVCEAGQDLARTERLYRGGTFLTAVLRH